MRYAWLGCKDKATELTEGCFISKWCNFKWCSCEPWGGGAGFSGKRLNYLRWKVCEGGDTLAPLKLIDAPASCSAADWMLDIRVSMLAGCLLLTLQTNPLFWTFFWMSLAWSKHWSWLWSSNKNAFPGSWIELCSIINCRSNWISVEAKILQYHMSVS